MPKLDEPRSREAWLGEGPRSDRAYVNMGEDLAFCMRAIDAGHRLWCYRMPGLRHHKTAPVSHDYDDLRPPAAGDATPADTITEAAQ